MSKLHALVDWMKANWVWLSPVVLGILANLYNGLAHYPKAQSFVRSVVDALSIVTHRDSPGTFKMPFKRSVAPNKMALPEKAA